MSKDRNHDDHLTNDFSNFVSHSNILLRDTIEVATRAMTLCLIAAKGEGLDRGRTIQTIHKYRLETSLTPKEREFVWNPSPSDEVNLRFSWRYESYWTLLWALGIVEELSDPSEICDSMLAFSILINRSREQFILESRLRPLPEILLELERIRDTHRKCKEAFRRGEEIPGNAEPAVLIERHQALNWLITYKNQEWDSVTTDT